jgi:hypothetical protein
MLFLLALCSATLAADVNSSVWSTEKANQWYEEQPWLAGCNYIPSTAINQLEMWQADTFDPTTINRELGWAHDIGFNTVRVYLHNLLWTQDPRGFVQRLEAFLDIAEKHTISVMFVLLDGVWDPFPAIGKQREPIPHVTNSGWVQSPGVRILQNPDRHDELQGYIQGVIGHFRSDARVIVWDIFNEPENINRTSYGEHEPENKSALALQLLQKAYAWARLAKPSQPITSAVWVGDWREEHLSPINRFMLENSDILSFHDYSGLETLREKMDTLLRYQRPILCTEYMARTEGSTFQGILPYFKKKKVGAYNWGFVAGKTQTIYPWDSWEKPYTHEPAIWFHDLFRKDGTPFDPQEIILIKRLTRDY